MESIRSFVENELARFGPAAGLADVVAAWPEAVGEAIAKNAWPARIGRDGTLVVHTVDSVWAFELQQRAVEIAERAEVKAIRFVPGPVPEVASETVPPPTVAPTEQHRLQAASLTGGIENSELREAVARAAAASLARTASGRSVW
jgi:hypothetical protein